MFSLFLLYSHALELAHILTHIHTLSLNHNEIILILNLSGQFQSSTCLGLLREILDLGLAEDDVGVSGRTLEDVRLADHEQDVLRLPDGDPGHSENLKSDRNISWPLHATSGRWS